MELALKELEDGKISEQKIIDDAVTFVTGIVNSDIRLVNKEFPCPKCGTGYLLYRKFKNKFNNNEMEELFICNNPECKQGFPVVKNKPKIVKCPDCEKGYMIKKHGKYGDFYGCSEYAAGCKKIMKEEDFLKAKK